MGSVQSTKAVQIRAGTVMLQGDLTLPKDAIGIVAFAHGSGSSRLSPRNRYVAGLLQDARLGTLLFDLLTTEEERVDEITAELRFDIPFLADRLTATTDWMSEQPWAERLQIGYFGASTGAAAALVAAAKRAELVHAVVSRGGRPDLAGAALSRVRAPTLLIVGELDDTVLALNRQALAELRCEKQLAIVPGATHLFEEPGTLEQAAHLARDWFVHCFAHEPVSS
ncbi:MAG TPA: dienelactone hydrolase family protein [Longimicrobiales bacterium]|nr:dienelactone hydrolase family protein [Longimicrobiales bacterium]